MLVDVFVAIADVVVIVVFNADYVVVDSAFTVVLVADVIVGVNVTASDVVEIAGVVVVAASNVVEVDFIYFILYFIYINVTSDKMK